MTLAPRRGGPWTAARATGQRTTSGRYARLAVAARLLEF
jgi:hypothetical protein